jgi:hypothetical protein
MTLQAPSNNFDSVNSNKIGTPQEIDIAQMKDRLSKLEKKADAVR